MTGEAAEHEAAGSTTVAVCICTYRRTDALRRLLERLVDDAEQVGDRARVGVVVIDDDPDRSATATVEAFADRFEQGVRLGASGTGNIARARNLALDRGREVADWIACIDDDCLPDPGWMGHLVDAQRDRSADCVSGACVDEAPPGAPPWLTDEPFLEGPRDLPDGAPIEVGHIKNTLVRSSLVGPGGVRFREALGVVGGEDTIFFRDMHAQDVAHVFAARAVVREQVPLERTSLRYQLRRRFWYGNTEAVVTLLAGRSSRVRVALGGIRRSLGALRHLVPSARGWWWRYGIAEVLRGVGRVLGAAGVRVDHH